MPPLCTGWLAGDLRLFYLRLDYDSLIRFVLLYGAGFFFVRRGSGAGDTYVLLSDAQRAEIATLAEIPRSELEAAARAAGVDPESLRDPGRSQ